MSKTTQLFVFQTSDQARAFATVAKVAVPAPTSSVTVIEIRNVSDQRFEKLSKLAAAVRAT